MKRGLRVASALVVALGCASGPNPGGKGGSNGSDLIDALPSGSDLVVAVDMAKLRQWPVAEVLWRLAKPALKQLGPGDLGFDPWTDVDRLGISVRRGGVERGEWLVVLEGRFDAKAIAGVRPAGGEIEDYRGSRVAILWGGASALIKQHRFVVGSRSSVRAALDVAANAAPSVRADSGIMALWSGVPDGSRVVLRAVSARPVGEWALGKGLQSLALRLEAKEGLDLQIASLLGSAAEAERESDVLREGIVRAAQSAHLDALADGLLIGSDGARMTVRLVLDGRQSQELAALIELLVQRSLGKEAHARGSD